MLDVKKTLTKITGWIGEKNYKGYGTGVAIDSYSSVSNMYTVPSDGIIRIFCTYRSGSYISLMNENGDAIAELATSTNVNSQGNIISSTQVYKGMKVYTNRSSNYSSATFYPYTT